MKEQHTTGSISIENLDIITSMDFKHVDFGLQISNDGRVWICINGIAFIRFRPEIDTNPTPRKCEGCKYYLDGLCIISAKLKHPDDNCTMPTLINHLDKLEKMHADKIISKK